MDELPVILEGRNVVIDISPCSRDVFAPLLNKLVYVLDSLMAGHYRSYLKDVLVKQNKIIKLGEASHVFEEW